MTGDQGLQRNITKIALAALDGRAFALAGSGALREHGIVDRLTHDADLFTNDTDDIAFQAAALHLIAELRRAGYQVEELRRTQQFAQLPIATADGQAVDLDLAMDWREHEPVTLSIGPVLSLLDAVSSKVSALYSRREARDYIDVDAIRSSGRFTDAELLTGAAERDAGFDVAMFAAQLEIRILLIDRAGSLSTFSSVRRSVSPPRAAARGGSGRNSAEHRGPAPE